MSNAIIRRRSSASSDPKPREGTETRGLWPKGADFACSRQTQNPERGRKRGWWASWRWGLSQVVRPKTPRGDGNLRRASTRGCRLRWSSDPKPREGTETRRHGAFRLLSGSRQTQNPERGRKPISGTATLREDTPSRQTQNPERGRKLAARHGTAGVARGSSDPKPREGTETHIGDGDAARGHAESSDPKPREGTETHIGDGDAARGHAGSSDPKPREGTETCIHSSPTRRTSASRQTQNPERGRKLVIASRRAWRADCRQTQNPERGRKHHPTQAPKSMTSRRQTQNPERGRKLVRHLCLIQVQCPVVRPKTPRGDGNLTARSFPASIR
ncbi:hypothetical protein AN42_02910 [Mycobacterium tuberculosis M1009]|nr:hypothetical protein AN42_02910 [Mycobacterium tuberculosis M1009]